MDIKNATRYLRRNPVTGWHFHTRYGHAAVLLLLGLPFASTGSATGAVSELSATGAVSELSATGAVSELSATGAVSELLATGA